MLWAQSSPSLLRTVGVGIPFRRSTIPAPIRMSEGAGSFPQQVRCVSRHYRLAAATHALHYGFRRAQLDSNTTSVPVYRLRSLPLATPKKFLRNDRDFAPPDHSNCVAPQSLVRQPNAGFFAYRVAEATRKQPHSRSALAGIRSASKTRGSRKPHYSPTPITPVFSSPSNARDCMTFVSRLRATG